MNVYFDNAATTMVRPEAKEAMLRAATDSYGNPSSAHYMGRYAASGLLESRKSVAGALKAKPDEIFFTSGGTESNNWAIFGCAAFFSKRRANHIITSEIEHESILAPIKKLEKDGWEVSYLTPGSDGQISPKAFADTLREDTAFASVMLVNNETGAINPVYEFSKEIRRRGFKTVLHTDAVQAFCKIPFTAKTPGADLITVSAHKIHGVKGAGALYVRNGAIKLPPLLLGGGQERLSRSGTEASPAIAAFAEAARLGDSEREETAAAVGELRRFICKRLKDELPETVIIADGSPFILSFSLPGFKSEVLANYLDANGICVSKGAACKKGAKSHVLAAMNLQKSVIDGVLRLSFSKYNTIDEAEYFVKTLKTGAEMILC